MMFCLICLEEEKQQVCGECTICQQCLWQYLVVLFESLSFKIGQPVRCPGGCDTLFHSQELDQLCRKYCIEPEFQNLITQKYLKAERDARACPKCNVFGIIPDKTCNQQLICENCSWQWDCPELYGWKKRLWDEIKRGSQNKGEFLSYIYHFLLTKTCPQCDIKIYKNGGCYHMTCKNCLYEFCWQEMCDSYVEVLQAVIQQTHHGLVHRARFDVLRDAAALLLHPAGVLRAAHSVVGASGEVGGGGAGVRRWGWLFQVCGVQQHAGAGGVHGAGVREDSDDAAPAEEEVPWGEHLPGAPAGLPDPAPDNLVVATERAGGGGVLLLGDDSEGVADVPLRGGQHRDSGRHRADTRDQDGTLLVLQVAGLREMNLYIAIQIYTIFQIKPIYPHILTQP